MWNRNLVFVTGILLASPVQAAEGQNSESPQGPASGWSYRPEGAVALPLPLSLGVEAQPPTEAFRKTRIFGEVSGFRYPVWGNSLPAAGLWGFRFGGRYYASGHHGWFAAAAAGFHSISASLGLSALKVEGETIASAGTAELRAFYFEPSIGYRYRIAQNWEASFELGLRIPFFASGRMRFENSENGLNSDNSELLWVNSSSSMTRIASLVLPEITLFRITWSPGR